MKDGEGQMCAQVAKRRGKAAAGDEIQEFQLRCSDLKKGRAASFLQVSNVTTGFAGVGRGF